MDEERQINKNDANVFSQYFQNFSNSQSKEIADSLENILTAGKNELAVNQNLSTKMNSFPTDLESLKKLQLEQQKEQANLNKKKEELKKAEAAAKKADEGLRSANAKGNPVDISKYENLQQTTHARLEEAQRAVEEGQYSYNEYMKNYQRVFIEKLGTNLNALSDLRLGALNELSPLADQIIQAANNIVQPSEPQIGILVQKLQELDTETIE